jgi:hypothetical protein
MNNMPKIIKSILSDLTAAVRELVGLAVILSTFYIVAVMLHPEALAVATTMYGSTITRLGASFAANLLTPYVILTVPMLGLNFYLLIRFFARDRAETFGVDTTRENYLSAARDYVAVLIFTFVAFSSMWHTFSGSYFIPVATLTGVVLAWWFFSIIMNFGGYGESVRDTIKDLAWVMGLLLVGKVVPAIFSGFTYSSVMEYFIEIGIVYAIGTGVGLVIYPGKGIVIPLSKIKIIARLQSYAIALFAYFGAFFFALVPLIIFLVPVVVVLLVAAVYFAVTGHFHELEDFASMVFFSTAMPRGKGLLIVAVYSPILYALAFFQSMIIHALRHWTGVVELVAFLSSLHYSLWKYRKRL